MAPVILPRRFNKGILRRLERPALLWMAQRLPGWVTPDFLTGVGFVGACMTAAGYALYKWHPAFLWLANAGFVVNWYGDSLDGTLARMRKIERPRYGFFLDQTLDAFEQLILAVGIGLSGLMRFELAMFTVAVYFLISILTLVRAVVANVFSLTYGGIGATELRLAFIILNVFVFFVPPQPHAILGLTVIYPEILSVAWNIVMIVSFLVIFGSGLRNLAIDETPRSNNSQNPGL